MLDALEAYNLACPFPIGFLASFVIPFSAVDYPNFCCVTVIIRRSVSVEIDHGVVLLDKSLRGFKCWKPNETEASRDFYWGG